MTTWAKDGPILSPAPRAPVLRRRPSPLLSGAWEEIANAANKYFALQQTEAQREIELVRMQQRAIDIGYQERVTSRAGFDLPWLWIAVGVGVLYLATRR